MRYIKNTKNLFHKNLCLFEKTWAETLFLHQNLIITIIKK